MYMQPNQANIVNYYLITHQETRDSKALRFIARILLVIFLYAVIWPSWAVAIAADQQQKMEEQQRWQNDNQNLDQLLGNLRNHINEHRQEVRQKLNDTDGFLNRTLTFIGFGEKSLPDEIGQRFQQQLNNLHSSTEQSFNAERQQLMQKGVSQEILDRQLMAKEKVLNQYQQLQQQLNNANQASTLDEQSNHLETLQEKLNSFRVDKPRDPFDPNNLPWGVPNPEETPEPAQQAEQLSQRYALPLYEQGKMLAAHVITPDMLGNLGGPTQADLDATLDAQLSDAIRAKAAELNYDPVAIYQWVRNSIEFIPSYGSVQGAQYTMEYQKGNAFDTASLLVALLRASNIPARYAFGTVQMPAVNVMNWVGNVNTPEAAGNLLGQGGIPNKALVSGGKVTHFELEHVWVEAWIDYLPSRGAKHKRGDSWIPMDASYKQYDYQEGMALSEAVPFDAQTLADSITEHSTINESEGWVQGLPQQDIEQALAQYQTQLEAYINTQNPDATVGDVLGTSSIKTIVHESLAASLPYELRTRKLVASSLTDNQRWKFKYSLGTALYGQMGDTLININQPTAALAGKKLALSFTPASEADEQLIASYLPEPDENGEIDPSQIPNTLPGYLIHLNAEFSIDNEVTTTANSSITMGSELLEEMGYWQPNRGWNTSRNQPVAGEYRAIALDLHGISASQAEQLKNDMESTQQKINTQDYTNLGKQQLVGDLLYATILSYFALNNVQDAISAKQANMVSYKAPSYGIFKTNITPMYWFGIPRNVKISGLTMDVDRITHLLAHKDNNHEQWVNYNRASGARLSAMEHLVPEQLFSTPENPAHGISAVKAIQLAAAEGQKIWTITQANLAVALANITLDNDIKNDIRNAVNAGQEVTTHEKFVSFYGKISAGYIILNPTTGAGAYMISSGENGGDIQLPDETDAISWLLSLLDAVGENPILKRAGGMLGNLIDAVGMYTDIMECGVSYGIAKYISTLFITIGVAFILLPFLAIFLSLYIAILSSFLAAAAIAPFFSSRWSCDR